MDWFSVIALILFGITLIVVETIFIPGTTIVGIFGFLVAGYGIYLGYEYFGQTTGTVILVTSSVIGFSVVFYCFKTEAWQRFSLKGESTWRNNEETKNNFEVGQEGVLVSTAKPIGKASFNDKEVEVSASGGMYLSENTPIRILKIESNKIIVEEII
jgi:membrane-bound ClpP family serine protease